MSTPVQHKPNLPLAASPRPVAVIDIGATSVRMAVAEICHDGEIRKFDTLVQPVDLGRETFESRRLSRRSIEKVASILTRYQRVLQEYGVATPSSVRVVATSAVREATNRLAFTDRVYVATGLEVEPIDEAEVNRITYMGIMPHLRAHKNLADGSALVIEVGGGNTEMLLIRAGNVLHSNSFRLGSFRLAQSIESVQAVASRRRSLLESHIRRTLVQVSEYVDDRTEMNLVALGGDVRFAARRLIDDWEGASLAKLSTKKLAKFTDEVLGLDEDGIVKRFGATFIEAETLAPALLAYTMLAEHFELSHVYVCDTNLRDGLLRDMAAGGDWAADFRNQIVRSASSLARRFDVDETHARNVAELAKRLFEQLQELHQLDSRQAVILYVAALLHEIGLSVSARSNHKHALYIIRNSELFGLSRRDTLLVGLVARYHRRASPQPSHEGYTMLDRKERVVVAKLASILRLAIALDDTRSGRIREIDCIREGKRLVILVPGVDDVSLEQLAMRQNVGMFLGVFGLPVMLRAGK